jgi:hypothetical protein
VPAALQFPVWMRTPAASACLIVSLMRAPPPMRAVLLSGATVMVFRWARLMRTRFLVWGKADQPLPPFWARKGRLWALQKRIWRFVRGEYAGGVADARFRRYLARCGR